ncbi:extracellular solute-binding protein [Tropicimonas sp. S265A]|uniref:extracellular solute-binding protein n=1 Tax=Tropicimonas sp. S265A TaxID=3415134 RepID=UPI003C79A8D4
MRSTKAVALSPKDHYADWRLCAGFVLVALSGLAAAQVRAEPITSHGISTFGDLKYPTDFAHLDYVNPDAPTGGEISVWAFGSFDSMNPYTLKGRAAGLSNAFFESLMTGTADEIGASYCLLCESLTYPEDRSEVTFTLREGIEFSDGSPLTTEDIVFSYNILLEKGLPSFRAQLAQKVETVEAIDPRTVRFVFKPDIPTRDLISDVGALPVFSKVHYEANDRDFEETSLEPLLGSGEYVLGRMDVGQTVVYERNPDYWGKDLPINIGRGNFDAIRIEYYADYNAAFEGFKGGTYTFRNEASSKIWATGYDFPAIQEGTIVKKELPNGAKATGQAWVFNLRRPQLQDPLVREAIGTMFNFTWSNETLFYGIYDQVDSLWDNSELEATGVPGPEEVALLQPLVDDGLLDASILTSEPFSYPESGPRQLDRGNLRRASALLDEAGWIVGDDGLRRKDGQTLRVEFLNDSQTFDRVINPFVENLKRLGVDARHTRIDNAQATARERPPQYDFDLVTTFMSTEYIPGSSLRQYFGSETADTSTFNKMGLKSEAVDRLIEVVLAAKSAEELKTSVHALDRVLRAEKFWIPQWNKNTHTVAYYDMYEFPETLPPYSLGNLDFWWFNAEKAENLRAKGAL